MLCNAALMIRLSNFYLSFKPSYSRIFCSSFKLFEYQTIRLSRVHCIKMDLQEVGCGGMDWIELDGGHL